MCICVFSVCAALLHTILFHRSTGKVCDEPSGIFSIIDNSYASSYSNRERHSSVFHQGGEVVGGGCDDVRGCGY